MIRYTIEAITPKIGAKFHVNAEDVTHPELAATILEALNTYNVLLFPALNLSDEGLIALTGNPGAMEAAKATVDGSEQSTKGIYRIALDKDDKTQREYVIGNNYWHMDGTSYQVPGKGTLLMCKNPPSTGGETEFASLFAAYAALPQEKKEAIENLRVIHRMAAVGEKLYEKPTADDYARWNAVFPDTEQPLVWHQASGNTSLVIGSTAGAILGMTDTEGKALLNELLEWCTQPQFTYRHTWQKGDLVIFNNPGLLHRSRPYSEEAGRVMHRTTLKGYEAIA